MKIYEGFDFNMGDINTVHGVKSWENCADLCFATAGCLYFNFNEVVKTCWLKDWIDRPFTKIPNRL